MENIEYLGEFTLQWHITHRCNLRCRHCYQDDYSAFTSYADMEAVLDQYEALLKHYKLKGHLNVTGGEPLMHPDIYRLLRDAHSRRISTGVLTNGTLFGEKEARLLKACGVSYVQISLDGCEKTHDKIRGRGSFDRAIRGVYALRSQGIFTSISFTAQKNNLHDFNRLARFCADVGVDKLWFDRVVIPADEDTEKLSLSKSEYKRLCKAAAKQNKKGRAFCGRALQFLPCREKNIYHCSAGDNLLVVLANGDVMPCRRLPIKIGNVRESDLLTLHRDSVEMHSLRNVGVPEGCKNCGYAGLCRGGAKCITYARTGRYDLPDPDCPVI